MARANGRPEINPQELDAEHELPPSTDDRDQNGPLKPLVETSPPAPAEPADELQKLRAERDTLRDALARQQAEFENARKRASREQQEFREFALADAIKQLLPILDSFERALHSAAHGKSEFRSGVELIYKQLHDTLQKLGLRPVAAKGKPFDPHLHEAIEMVDTADAADHEVLDELQRGYKLKDRLLRPAMVRVARNSKHSA